MNFIHNNIRPAQLLLDHVDLFLSETLPGPILDLACGDCSNGIFLAQKGLQVTCCDRSRRSLDQARGLAGASGTSIQAKQVDLEQEGVNPLPEDAYGAILVFRYLHRPLIPYIKKALSAGGLLMYETFTVEQPRFGKPRNPDFLLNPGELLQLFNDWEVIHFFEGIKEDPKRAVAQLVCRKPGTGSKQRADGGKTRRLGDTETRRIKNSMRTNVIDLGIQMIVGVASSHERIGFPELLIAAGCRSHSLISATGMRATLRQVTTASCPLSGGIHLLRW